MIDIYFDPTSHTHTQYIYTYSQKIASFGSKNVSRRVEVSTDHIPPSCRYN